MKTGYIILIVFVVLIIGSVLASRIELCEWEICQNKTEDVTGNVVKNVERFPENNNNQIGYGTKTGSEKNVIMSLNADEFKAILSKTEFYNKLPDDARVLFSFYDGNGKVRNDMNFLITKGNVEKKDVDDYDLRILTGDYYINKMKSTSDFCSFIKDIKAKQDMRVETKVNKLILISKYAEVYKYKSCFGL